MSYEDLKNSALILNKYRFSLGCPTFTGVMSILPLACESQILTTMPLYGLSI